MATPGDTKPFKPRILATRGRSAGPMCRALKPRGGAVLTPSGATPEDRARTASLYFGDLLHAQVLAFNPKYKEAEARWWASPAADADISGNRDFLTYLRNQGKFFCAEEMRELDLMLIDYGDLTRTREQWRNVYEVTEEFYVHNGRTARGEDVVLPHQTASRCW